MSLHVGRRIGSSGFILRLVHLLQSYTGIDQVRTFYRFTERIERGHKREHTTQQNIVFTIIFIFIWVLIFCCLACI